MLQACALVSLPAQSAPPLAGAGLLQDLDWVWLPPPQVTLQEMLVAFQEVLARSDMFAHHHVQREPLSVRQRMSDVLAALNASSFLDFVRLFRPDEGRRGVTVTARHGIPVCRLPARFRRKNDPGHCV